MKRAATALLTLVFLAAPSAVLAKVPWFSVELLPAAPVAGEPFVVVVRFWNDAAQTRPVTWWPNETVGGLVRLDDAGERPLSLTLKLEGPAGQAMPITLSATSDAAFQGEVVLPEGRWRLVAVPRYSGASGPTDVEMATITVAAESGASVPIGAAVIGITLVAAGTFWRRRSTSRF